MNWRLLGAVVLLFGYAIPASLAEAKGGPNAVDFVVVSGGQLAEQRHIPITLPDNYDYMSERFDLGDDAVLNGRAQFGIVIHVSWPEERDNSGTVVQEAQIWEIRGRYDGDSLIHLAETQHGNRAGWLDANPLFAEQLREGVAPGAPLAGNSLVPDGSDEWWSRSQNAGLALICTALLFECLWLVRRGSPPSRP